MEQITTKPALLLDFALFSENGSGRFRGGTRHHSGNKVFRLQEGFVPPGT